MNAVPLLLFYIFHKMSNGAGPLWPGRSSPPPQRARKGPSKPAHHVPAKHATPAEQAAHANQHDSAPAADMQMGPVETIKHGRVTHREPTGPDLSALNVGPLAKRKRAARRKPKPQSAFDGSEHHDAHAAAPEQTQAAPAASNVESHQAPARTAEQAAQDLYDYVTSPRHKNLGLRGSPSETVRAAQRDMGTTPDGIYGPNDRARGKMLIGRTFPPRTAVAGTMRRPMYIP